MAQKETEREEYEKAEETYREYLESKAWDKTVQDIVDEMPAKICRRDYRNFVSCKKISRKPPRYRRSCGGFGGNR
jgi:hypothetical protein